MRLQAILTLFLAAGMLPAQIPFTNPQIFEGPYNAASYPRQDWPGAGVAQGSMFVVKGMLLGPSRLVQVNAFPLPTELAGTSIEVVAGGTTVKPYMIYTSYGQVAAILPSGTPIGEAQLTVSADGKRSAPVKFRVVRNGFGIFTRNQAGTGPGILQNVESESVRPVNALHLPARAGQAMILWGTGLGPVSTDEQGQVAPGDLPFALDVFVGGRPATLLYKGRSGCCAGIDQIVFEVPPGVQGCRVPVVVRVDGLLSNFVTMSIAEAGRMCPDPPMMTDAQMGKLARGESLTIGSIELLRLDVASPHPDFPGLVMDLAYASFVRYQQYELLRATDANSYWRAGAPSPGHCLVMEANSNEDLPVPVHEDPYSNGPRALRPLRLNAGSGLYISGAAGVKEMWRSNDAYFGFLGGADPESGTTHPVFLQPGQFSVDNRDGGSDVPAFKASVTVPPPVEWLNEANINEVNRSEDLTITWRSSNPDGEMVTVFAASGVESGTTSGLLCTQYAAAGSITVPSWLLSAMVPSHEVQGLPLGFLLVANSPLRATSTIAVQGTDAAVLQYIEAKGKLVRFR